MSNPEAYKSFSNLLWRCILSITFYERCKKSCNKVEKRGEEGLFSCFFVILPIFYGTQQHNSSDVVSSSIRSGGGTIYLLYFFSSLQIVFELAIKRVPWFIKAGRMVSTLQKRVTSSKSCDALLREISLLFLKLTMEVMKWNPAYRYLVVNDLFERISRWVNMQSHKARWWFVQTANCSEKRPKQGLLWMGCSTE